MGFLSGLTHSIGKFAKGAVGLVGKGVHEGEKVAMNFANAPGRIISGNLKSLGLSANTLLMVAAGIAVLVIVTQPGGVGPIRRR
jgi:hypothetical protein